MAPTAGIAGGVGFRLDLSELDMYKDVLDLFDGVVLEEMVRAGTAIIDTIDLAVKVRTPVDRGFLRGSIIKSVAGDLSGHLRGEVYTNMIHGWPMELGRRPGRYPPAGPLALWLIRKGLASREEALISAKHLAAKIAAGTSRLQRAGGYKMFSGGMAAVAPQIRAYLDNVPPAIADRMEGMLMGK